MNGMKGIVRKWIYPRIIFVVTASQTYAGSVYIIPGYDLDRDGFGEFILIDQSKIRYVELTKHLQHEDIWSKPFDEIPFLLNHTELITSKDSSAQFLVFSGTRASADSKNSSVPLDGYSWVDSTFSDSSVSLVSGLLNGDRYRPGHISYSENANLAAVSVNSPSRNIIIYQPEVNAAGFSLEKKIDLLSMKNGIGKIICEWFGTEQQPLLAVFSIESDSVLIDVFKANAWGQPAFSGTFKAPESPVLSYNILSRDLSGDGFSEVLVPFENDDVYAISVLDSMLAFSPSDISQAGLFLLPDSPNQSDINSLLGAQVNAGLIDPDFILFYESGFPDSLELAFIDTVSVGDTVAITASPDSSAGFYSFRWTRRQPESAFFDPLTGSIRWNPENKDIGHHVFSYAYEVRIRESLVEDIDEFGDRHQIVPVLAAGDSTWGIVVVDSAAFVPPPVIHPPYPERMYSIAVRTNTYDSTAFNFSGVASYQLSTEMLPGRTGLHHSISTNIAAIPSEDEISFSYVSSSESKSGNVKLTLIHDLNSNVLSAALDPTLDSLPQTFYPGDWDQNLKGFPEYLFRGFTQDIVMDSLGKSIVFHDANTDIRKDSFDQWIEVVGPSRPDHVMRILFNDGSLQEIKGTVRFRDDGSATTVSEFGFSEEFYPGRIMCNMIPSDDDSIRTKVIPALKLEDRTSSENSDISDS